MWARVATLGALVVTSKAALSSDQRTLLWSDEFDGTTIDSANWNHEVLPPYKYNNELQAYTDSSVNSYVSQGNLYIRAIQGGAGYTSARLTTNKKHTLKYGYVEVRAKLPTFQGAWPAIWMLPGDNRYGGWPKSGEMDIMEHVTCDTNIIHSTCHTGAYNWMNGNAKGGSVDLGKLGQSVTDFHLYQLEWAEDLVRYGVDGKTVSLFVNDKKKDPNTWPFDQPFFLLLNIAVGGDWGGYCLSGRKPNFADDGKTNVMVVDYVRFYSPSSAPDPEQATCGGPFDEAKYSSCQSRITWMQSNWDNEKYTSKQVDGSLCSIQHYLAFYEGYCPDCSCSAAPTAKPTPLPTFSPNHCAGPYPAEYPDCENRIKWMLANWDTVSWKQSYIDKGVDGSRCSIQRYLNDHEPYCPPIDLPVTQMPTSAAPTTAAPTTSAPTSKAPTTSAPTSKAPTTSAPTSKAPTTSAPTSKAPTTPRPTTRAPTSSASCVMSPNSLEFPHCEDHMSWMLANWQSNPSYARNGVDGSRCSVITYLATVEKWCSPCECSEINLVRCVRTPNNVAWKEFRRTATPLVCADHCESEHPGSYVAVQGGYSCACLPAAQALSAVEVPSSSCNIKCTGPGTFKCGGSQSASLYLV